MAGFLFRTGRENVPETSKFYIVFAVCLMIVYSFLVFAFISIKIHWFYEGDYDRHLKYDAISS